MKPYIATALLGVLLLIPGLSAAKTRIDAIQQALQEEVDASHTAGAVAIVLKNGKVVHHDATGFANREEKRAMTTDAVFWIASMTKSVSVTAIMTLVDEGKLDLDKPAATWLPQLGKVKLADGSPPSRPITLRDLMSHTSGLAFPPRKATDGAQSLDSYVTQLVKAPLAFEPGSDYQYGFGITVAGRIAELVSGKSFETLMNERILGPLGMEDTMFHPTKQLRKRLASSYKTGEDGQSLVRAYNPFVTPSPAVRRMTEPSGGLFSTASDMARFYQMILDGGVYKGKLIVSKNSISEMTRSHHAGGKELTYGLGWMTNSKKSFPGYVSESFGHGGAYATHGWIDPVNKTVAVVMVQNTLIKAGNTPRAALHKAVAEALIK